MFGNKTKAYYEMSKEQFEELKRFYETLGYNEKQVKALTKSCFGAEIKVTARESYHENWCFYRRREREMPMPGMNFFKGAPGGGRGRAKAASMMVMDESAPMMGMAAASMPSMPVPMEMAMREPEEDGACAPMEGEAAPLPSQRQQPNTAETHDAPENEKHSPLDASQLIFSANVNTASWGYLRNRIARHQSVDPSFVRVEEVLNSYTYDLPAPPKEDLFAISAESGACPWNEESELLFLGFKGRKADKDCRQNLALLVDVSGSMEDEWILTQMSIAAIMSKLQKGDVVSIIAYSDETTTVVKQLACGNMDKCVDAILAIDGIGGCTNGSEGLTNAYEYLQENFDEDANNRVFIFTDGDFNFGITAEGGLKKFIEDKRQTGIYLSIVGYGERNFKDNKMETLARNGNGNYTFVANPADILDNLWEKLVSSLVTVAKNVKISVEFNPAYVKEYRLIGYDARLLTQQEFHDTEKAVDGMGSEHNVVALIELQRGQAQQQYKSRYVTVSTEDSGEEFAFIEVHYQSPSGENLVMTHSVTLADLKAADNRNMAAASLLASFGLMVKDSAYKGKMSGTKLLDMVSALLKQQHIETPPRYSHLDIIRKFAVE